jgi:hypothetical protein
MNALARVPVTRIVAAIADAAARWSDADFPPRVRLLDPIAQRTTYSLPVIEFALDTLFFSLNAASIEAVIRSELGSLRTLDGFAERPQRPRAYAHPLGRVCVISSRTTIGVALVPAIFALCAKCEVLVKDREDGLVAAFFTSLAEELDAFAQTACAQPWEGETKLSALDDFDAVVAFGSDNTLAQIHHALPRSTRFIGFGSKASIGYVAREALQTHADAQRIAAAAARDLVLYDSEGCLSLHALFVEHGGAIEPYAFAEIMADAVERTAVEFPLGIRDAAVSAQLAAARRLAEFRRSSGRGTLLSDPDLTYLLLFDPPQEQPPPFLPRAMAIHPIEAPSEALGYLQRHRIPIEAAAITGSRADVVEAAVAMGANRLAAFGELQRPPLAGNHGGRARILDFIRWVSSDT